MFTPGTQPDRVAKMLAAGTADTLIIDWEDAVAPGDKAKARQTTKDSWAAFPRSRTERVIRINAVGTEWHNEDLEAAVALAPDAIVLPKAERPLDVDVVAKRMWELEGANTVPQLSIRLMLILESGRGVSDALHIAESSNRIDALIFGAEDYQADLGGRRRKDNLDVWWARSRVVAAAAAAKVQAIDQVFIDYHDPAGLKAEAEQARDLGYRGKMVIHPSQVPVVNEVFTPSVPEIQWAIKVLTAAQQAEREGKGAFALDGKMIDRPLIEQANLVIKIARAAGRVQ
jgi:citrate lyase beta subunit